MPLLKRLCQWIARRRYPAVLIGLGLLLALPSLGTGVQLDDFVIRAAVLERELIEGVPRSCWEPFTFVDGDPQHTHAAMDHGLMPWWADPELRLAFWRPLTAVTHMLDFRLWPRRPWLMHAQSLVWFGLLVWAVAVLYRRLIGREHAAWIAALAALLFTLDDAHALPVAWLANRNALLAGLCGVLTLIAHDRWRQDGWRPGAVWAPLVFAVGLLCKEATASAGGYLLAYTIFLDRGRWPGRLLSLLPYLAVGAVWFGLYQALGFGVVGSGVYIDPSHDPIGFALQVARCGPILLLGQWGLPPSELSVVMSAAAYRLHWLFAVVFLTVVGVGLLPLIARDRLARFWTMGMLLAVLPACVAFAMDRLLLFVGIGAMGLLAQWLGGLSQRSDWVPRRAVWRRPAGVLAGVLLAIHLVAAPVIFWVMIHVPRAAGRESAQLMDTFPADPEIARQTVVVVNPLALGAHWYLTLQQDIHRRPVPQRSLDLASACSVVRLTRIDPRTLAVRPHGGYLPRLRQWPGHPRPPMMSSVHAVHLADRFLRSDRRPLALGQTVELTVATIEITELTADGRVAEARFRFQVPLEDPSLRWLKVTRQGYEPMAPPAVGQAVDVATFRWDRGEARPGREIPAQP